jgi:hypothetical protein
LGATMRSLRYIAIISVVALIASLFIIVSVTSRPPKESKIGRDFSAHRAAYEQMRTMLSEDKGVDLVADWGIENTDSPISKMPPDGGMSVARYQEYLALLKQIGARLVSRGEEPLEVCFGMWASGFAGETRHVEVCWLDREPSNTVASLDAFYRTAKPRKPSYVHIDERWYIWADW